MATSIKANVPNAGDLAEVVAQRALLAAVLVDLTAIRASFLLLTAKLDADATVTDVDYASLTNPAALTLTA